MGLPSPPLWKWKSITKVDLLPSQTKSTVSLTLSLTRNYSSLWLFAHCNFYAAYHEPMQFAPKNYRIIYFNSRSLNGGKFLRQHAVAKEEEERKKKSSPSLPWFFLFKCYWIIHSIKEVDNIDKYVVERPPHCSFAITPMMMMMMMLRVVEKSEREKVEWNEVKEIRRFFFLFAVNLLLIQISLSPPRSLYDNEMQILIRSRLLYFARWLIVSKSHSIYAWKH